MTGRPFGALRLLGLRAVRYEVRVASDGSRFELERDEPPGEGEFDGVIEVEWQAGPAQAG